MATGRRRYHHSQSQPSRATGTRPWKSEDHGDAARATTGTAAAQSSRTRRDTHPDHRPTPAAEIAAATRTPTSAGPGSAGSGDPQQLDAAERAIPASADNTPTRVSTTATAVMLRGRREGSRWAAILVIPP